MALDAVHVLGNHDRYLIDRPPEKMGSWDRPAHAQLDAAHVDWLRTVPADACLARSGISLPRDTRATTSVYWLETVLPDGSVRMSALEAIEAAAAGITQRLILCAPYPYRARGAARRRTHGGQSRQRRLARLSRRRIRFRM